MFNVSQRGERAALASAPFTPLKGLYSGLSKGAKGPYNRRPSVRYGLNSLSIKFLKIYETRSAVTLAVKPAATSTGQSAKKLGI